MNSKIIAIILITLISTVLIMLLIGVLYFNNLQPQTIPPSIPERDDGLETISIIYNQPDLVAFNEMDLPDYEYKEEYAAPDPLPIEVSAGDEALEAFLNAVIAYEEQFLKIIPAAMYAVQVEAGRGNFMQMFRNIEAAIVENERGQMVNDDLNATRNALQNQLSSNTTADARTRIALNDTLQKVTPITTISDQLIDQLGQTLTGAVPSQEILSEIDQSQTVLAEAWLEFMRSLEITIDLLRQNSTVVSPSS